MKAVQSALLTTIVSMFTGCIMHLDPVTYDQPTDSGVEVVVEESSPFIDAYVPIRSEVREIISEHVYGYSMPSLSRYSFVLYPRQGAYDFSNLPSYVESDFNDDGYSDYAYMFSKVNWSGNSWYLSTKLIVVLSSPYGYVLGTELNLGTVTDYASHPVEEYWAIRLLKAGTHIVTTYNDGIEKEISVTLDNDGFYLASLDPEERSVFTAEYDDVYELYLDMGSIAKRTLTKDNRAQRVIRFSSSAQVVKWPE